MKKKIFTEEEQKKIISMYKNGHGSSYISKEINSSASTILNFLREQRIQINGLSHINNRLFTRNDSYFEKINSNDKAYFFGFLLADGNNYLRGIRMELQIKDKEILEKFKRYINYSGKIVKIKRIKNGRVFVSCKIGINSKKLADDCSKLGMIPNKTFKTFFPRISKEFYSHFIRGYFDGDGSIYKNNIKKGTWNFNITGNILLISEIQRILSEECNLSLTKIQPKGNKGIGAFNYGGNTQMLRIREYLYKDCDDLYLVRKREKFNLIN